MTTLLADVVDASEKATRTSSRLAKRAAYRGAACAAPETSAVEIAVAYLCGVTRQGRIGIGYSALAGLRGSPAATTRLDVGRCRCRARPDRGHHRQGISDRPRRASGGAVRPGHRGRAGLPAAPARRRAAPGRARGRDGRRGRGAAGVPAAAVRRAAMLAGGLAQRRARRADRGRGGARALRPRSCIAAGAADARAAGGRRRRRAGRARATRPFEWKLDGARMQVHKAGDEVRVYTRT